MVACLDLSLLDKAYQIDYIGAVVGCVARHVVLNKNADKACLSLLFSLLLPFDYY